MIARWRLTLQSLLTSPEGRYIAYWLAELALLSLVMVYGVSKGAETKILWQFASLVGINTVIFLSLFTHFSAIGKVMLIFNLMFILAMLGYFYTNSLVLGY